MKKLIHILLGVAFWCAFLSLPVYQTGCASLMLKNLREKIPVGYAETITGHVNVTVGGGAGFSGKDVESKGGGKFTAGEWSEQVTTPWGSSGFTMTNGGLGVRKPKVIVVKPDGTPVVPPEPEPSAITIK